MKKDILILLFLTSIILADFIIWQPRYEQIEYKDEVSCVSVLKVIRVDSNDESECLTYTTEDKNRQQFFIQDSVPGMKEYYIVRKIIKTKLILN